MKMNTLKMFVVVVVVVVVYIENIYEMQPTAVNEQTIIEHE